MENAVEIVNLGKMYRLFDKQSDRIQDIFGLDKLRFWDREPRYREFWALRNIQFDGPQGRADRHHWPAMAPARAPCSS